MEANQLAEDLVDGVLVSSIGMAVGYDQAGRTAALCMLIGKIRTPGEMTASEPYAECQCVLGKRSRSACRRTKINKRQ